MRHAATLMLCLCTLLAACGSQSEEQLVQPQAGIISNREYQYAPIGWRISIPWRWSVLSQEELHASLGKGLIVVEKAVGGEFVDPETQLLHLRYGARNRFSSAISPFDATLGSEQEQVAATVSLVLATFKAGNMRALPIAHETETIDGIRFDFVHISILDPSGRREILQAHFYMGRVGSNWLTVGVASVDWIPRQQMLHAWRGSRFSPLRETD